MSEEEYFATLTDYLLTRSCQIKDAIEALPSVNRNEWSTEYDKMLVELARMDDYVDALNYAVTMPYEHFLIRRPLKNELNIK